MQEGIRIERDHTQLRAHINKLTAVTAHMDLFSFYSHLNRIIGFLLFLRMCAVREHRSRSSNRLQKLSD